MTTLAVVGASLAGLSTARAARAQGFDGELIIIGDEDERPYDRPPLSKEFLAGKIQAEDLRLEGPDDAGLEAEWLLGTRAMQLDPSTKSLWLTGGQQVRADHVVLATGASARWLMLAGSELPGVHVLRTLEDATALREELRPGARLVVVGAGFIGAEVASTALGLGLDVTVLEVGSTPLAGPLGETMGAVIGGLHAARGVDLQCGVTIDYLDGTDRVTGVVLSDTTVIPADVVVVGVGAEPNVQWLAGSGLDVANGISCDEVGRTGVPNVSAVGDCAAWFDQAHGMHRRVEHWTGALERPAVAIAHLLGTGAVTRPVQPPYFWSDQYGVRLQFAGASSGADRVVVEEGSTEEESFLAVFWHEDHPIGVLGVNRVRAFTRWRRTIAREAQALASSSALATSTSGSL